MAGSRPPIFKTVKRDPSVPLIRRKGTKQEQKDRNNPVNVRTGISTIKRHKRDREEQMQKIFNKKKKKGK